MVPSFINFLSPRTPNSSHGPLCAPRLEPRYDALYCVGPADRNGLISPFPAVPRVPSFRLTHSRCHSAACRLLNLMSRTPGLVLLKTSVLLFAYFYLTSFGAIIIGNHFPEAGHKGRSLLPFNTSPFLPYNTIDPDSMSVFYESSTRTLIH